MPLLTPLSTEFAPTAFLPVLFYLMSGLPFGVLVGRSRLSGGVQPGRTSGRHARPAGRPY